MKNKTKRKNRIFRVLLATMLILFGVSFRNDGKIGISGVQSVQAATKNVVVRFWNQSGKTSYSKLRIKVSAGKKIKLPAVPAITGYKNLGWSTQKNDTKAVYAAGKKIRLKKNINLYAVRKKVGIYKVYFYKSHNTDAFIFIDFIFYADAPLGRSFLVTVIVIAVYIEYRTFTKGCQKGKIFRI